MIRSSAAGPAAKIAAPKRRNPDPVDDGFVLRRTGPGNPESCAQAGPAVQAVRARDLRPDPAAGADFPGAGHHLPRPGDADRGRRHGRAGRLRHGAGAGASWNCRLLKEALENTTKLAIFVLFILIGSTVFSFTFNAADGHIFVEHLFSKLPGGALGFLIVVNLLVFVLGMFIDFFEIAFIVVPLIAPVAEKILPALLPAGSDALIWFGVIIAMNLQTSFLTPPFGFALFYLRSVAAKSDYNDRITGERIPAVTTNQIYSGAIAFIVLQVIMVAAVVIYPNLVLDSLDKPPVASATDPQLEAPPTTDLGVTWPRRASRAIRRAQKKRIRRRKRNRGSGRGPRQGPCSNRLPKASNRKFSGVVSGDGPVRPSRHIFEQHRGDPHMERRKFLQNAGIAGILAAGAAPAVHAQAPGHPLASGIELPQGARHDLRRCRDLLEGRLRLHRRQVHHLGPCRRRTDASLRRGRRRAAGHRRMRPYRPPTTSSARTTPSPSTARFPSASTAAR
jgi:hypothetical protein